MSAAPSPISCLFDGATGRFSTAKTPVAARRRGERISDRPRGARAASPISARSCMARRSAPTRCSSARARASASSRRRAFATCSRCAAATGRAPGACAAISARSSSAISRRGRRAHARRRHDPRRRRRRMKLRRGARELAREGRGSAGDRVHQRLRQSAPTSAPPRRRRARSGPTSMSIASHEILPEIREFERASTTALNAYLQPVVGNYLNRLQGALEQRRVSRASSISCSRTAA